MSSVLFEALTPARLAETVPRLHVGGPLATGTAQTVGEREQQEARQRALATRGWFELALTSVDRAERLDDAILRLAAASLPLAALYVFDEVWELALALREAVSRAVGVEYVLVEDLWAFAIAPGSAGWSPHRGTYAMLDRQEPEYVNAWVALSDVGPERSCLHFVPLDEDRAYAARNLAAAVGAVAVATEVDPGAGTAAPLARGEALAWNANVVHWGGPCAPTALGPRTSISFTLCRADAVLREDLGAVRTIDPTTLDPWARLAVIAGQVLLYGDRDGPMSDDVRAWATATSRLAARFSRG